MIENIFKILYFLFPISIIYIILKKEKNNTIRVNDYLIIRRCLLKKNKITLHQSLSKSKCKELNNKINFGSSNVKASLIKDFKNSSNDLEQFLSYECKYEVIHTKTNELMEKRLINLKEKGIISLEIDEKSLKVKPQPIPKLLLMGIKTTKVKLSCKEYWTYIFRKENIKEYKLIVNKKKS